MRLLKFLARVLAVPVLGVATLLGFIPSGIGWLGMQLVEFGTRPEHQEVPHG